MGKMIQIYEQQRICQSRLSVGFTNEKKISIRLQDLGIVF